jgi:hypothetical protein
MAEERDPNYGQLSTSTSAKEAIENPPPKDVDGKPKSVDTQTVAGNAISGPRNTSGMNNKQAMIATLNSAASGLYKEDKHQYNKLTTFNSSHTGHNFDRYYASPGFKKLGFSPFRDNESFYNQNTSLWDDAIRGGITAGKLAWLGGTSTFKNWGSMFSSEGNTEDSDEMERLMSVGMSSREGFGAKVVNFGVNMGYTYGVVGEILAEEAALALGTAFTGGGLGGVAGVRTGMNIGRIAKAFEGFKAISTISKAREIWNSSKALQGVGKLASHLAPFEQSRALLTTGGKAAAKWGELTNMAKVSKSFGAFYRDLREINAVTSEARLEGGGIQSGVTNQLIADFKKDKGRDPNDQEAEAIFRQAHQAGVTGSLMNSAGIYLSNKVVLDRALKGIPGMEAIGEGATRKIRGSFLLNKGWKAAGKEPRELVKGLKQLGRADFYKQTFNPKNLTRGGLGYLSANLMEGTQEVYQEAVAKGLTDYYISTYNDPSRVGSAEFKTKLLSGLKSQGSQQGLETFLSGFLMAGPMSGMQSAFYGTVDMIKQKKLKKDAAAFAENPDNAGKENPFQRELDIQGEFENKTLEALNDTTKNAPAYFSALERDIKIQNDLARASDEAAAGGDVKAVKDARDASLVSHTLTLLQAGKFNIFEEQLKSLGELSGTELQEAFGEDPNGTGKTVAERLKAVQGRIKEIKSSFEEYQSMINPHTMEKNPMGFLAFEQGREIMISDDIRYKRTGQRMADLYTEFSSNLPFSKANGADFANLFSIGDPQASSIIGQAGMRSEIALLNQEIAVAEGGDDAAKLRAGTLKKKRDSLSTLSALVQLHKAQYTVNQSVNQTDESFAENEKALGDLDIQLKDAFVNHIKVLAEQNGQNVLTKDLDRAYQQFSDYWKLNADQGQMANALNAMHDPYMFNQSVQRLESAMTSAMAQREAKLKDALREFLARRHKNKFFNDLFDNFNAFIDPEEADAYINENEVPTTFFDADSMEEIKPGSEKYKGIMALIDEYDDAYFEKEGKRMMRTGTGGLMSFRGKEENDKRTIKQLGEEYGFDHTDVLSYVNIEKVLKAVITSKFASKDMKKLAQALLSIVDKNTQITFKTNHFTNSTYDDVNGVIVDPKFSAEGFTTGLVPMEFSILNGIMQQVMDKSLEDTDFNDRMTVLREKLIENLTDEQKKEFQLAMKDNSGFVAEVMTNPYIQGILDSIPLEGEATAQTAEAKTLWQSFLDEVKALLEKLFGSKRSASLYDEAVTVITNKLSQPGVVAADPIAEETFDEPTEDADLEKLLKEGFDAALAPLNAEERAGMNYQAWKDASREARDITNKYKADKIKKGTAPKPEGPTPLTESERKKQMTALGYTIAEMNSLTADQVNQIIAEKKKKRIYVDTLRGEMNFDEFPPMLDYIDDVIDEADLKLQSANLGLSADKKVYIQFDALGRPIAGTEHERVSNVVKTKDGEIGKESSDRGNIIDSLLRDFLNRTITDIEKFKTKYEEYRAENPSAGAFSEKMLEDLFDKFRSVELFIKQKGLKIRANIPALYGTIGETRTAGSIDLLAFDPAGRVFIIDLKTSTQDRRMQYKLEEMLEAAFGAEWPGVREVIRASKGDLYKAENRVSAEQKAKLKAIYTDPQFSSNIKKYKDTEYFPVYFYKSEDARQQNAYMELLRQTTGIKAYGTFIFPLILSKTNNIYTSVEFQKEDGNHTMNVKRYDIHKEMGLDNQVTAYPEDPLSKEKLDEFRETPEEGPTPTPTPTPTPQPTGEIDIVNTPSQDIIDELNKKSGFKADLRAMEQRDLLYAIPNIESYKDASGKLDKSKLSPLELQMYNQIYEKYDKLISPLLKTEPKTGTQTQMDFDELTLNVGDRVKVNTPKDGEGIIKEDRGDKVLLEDGRQVMKKSLTKLEPVDNEPVIVESTIPESLKGKVIFVTPTKESTTMLTGIPGVTYGSTIYLDRVLEGFDDTLIENLRNGLEKLSEETDDAKKVKTAGSELLDILDRYKSPDKDVTTDDVKTINGALVRLTNQTAESYIPASIITKLKKIQSNAWNKTMSDARSLANEGQTVVFDLNGAAASGKIDLALISATSDLGDLGYNYDKAIANIKGKSYNITGKNILDILNGTVDLDYTIPEIIREKLLANINEASKKELSTVEILVSRLPKAVLDQVLASQNLTMDQVNKAIATRKNKLATIFDMDDLVVDKANPTVVQYTVNEITGKQEFGGQGRKQGVVISNDGLRVRLAEFVPGLSFEDLEESENVVTFTAKEVPYFILPLKPQTPTTVDPDVNAQSDEMMNDPVSDPATSMSNLKTDLDSAKDVSAADALASFKKNQKCNKKGK